MINVVVGDGVPRTMRGTRLPVTAWRDDDGQPFAEAFADGGSYWLEWRGIGTMMFSASVPTVTLWPAPHLNASEAVAAFYHTVQPIILQAQGRQTLHASAVRVPEGVIAFCGIGGSGKSTLAYAIGRRKDASQVADDALVLEVSEAGVDVLPLRFTPRLRPPSERFFGGSAPVVSPPLPSPSRLLAVVVLGQYTASDEIALTTIPPVRAFTTLLTHAHCFDESNREAMAAMLRAYLVVAEVVPVYSLQYRPDFTMLPALEALVLREVGSVPVAAPHAR